MEGIRHDQDTAAGVTTNAERRSGPGWRRIGQPLQQARILKRFGVGASAGAAAVAIAPAAALVAPSVAHGAPAANFGRMFSNLLRHLTWSIPSGQAIAEAMNIQPLDRSELDDIGRVGRANGVGNLDRSTPLWFYIVREAEHRAGSMTLGPVGGRIVGEVIIGLLQTDTSSFLNQRGWHPNVPIAGQRFAMTDFLTFAGVGGRR